MSKEATAKIQKLIDDKNLPDLYRTIDALTYEEVIDAICDLIFDEREVFEGVGINDLKADLFGDIEARILKSMGAV